MIDAEKELAKLAASAAAGRPAAKKPAAAAGKPADAGKPAAGLTLRLVKSGICTPKDHKATLRGLGLRRLGQRVVRPDTPDVRGMVHKVRHLVVIEAEN